MFLCTCKMNLWPPCRKILVQTLKTICSNSGNDEKIVRLPKKTPQDVRRNMHNEFWASLPWLCCQEYEKLSRTPKLLKIQFFKKIYFFHQKWFFSNGEGNFDNGSKQFSLRIHRFSAQIPKTTKKKNSTSRKENTFPKNVPMYTYNAVVTTLPKFSCQNFENFLLQFQKLWKSDELSKKPTGQNVRLNMYKEVTKFRQACRNHAAKITENLFLSKSQKDSNAIFFEKSNSSFSPSFKKKFSSGYAESSCDHPVKKFLVKTLKTVCSNSGNDEKIVRLPKKNSRQNVRLTCTMKFWQAQRNFVPKNTKKFPELQKCWS